LSIFRGAYFDFFNQMRTLILMYIHVRLLNGFNKLLTYQVPSIYQHEQLIGRVVQVPLRNQLVHALVEHQFESLQETPSFTIRELNSLNAFPQDPHYVSFINKLAEYQQIESYILIQRIQQFLTSEKEDEAIIYEQINQTQQVVLTEEQEKVYSFLAPYIEKPLFQPTLVHGVTGSGKTEIYKKLILKAYQKNKTSIVLLPEVTLALQFAHLFKHTLAVPVLSFHSHNTKKEKELLWQTLLAHKPIVIIGVHLPIMLPIGNLGLIIVDEEHEVGYQEKKHPKINTKEAALLRAQHYQIPILLGSATPSTTSLYNSQKKGWKFFQLTKRYAGNFPIIKIINLTEKKHQRKNFWISKELEQAIRQRLEKKEQTIIFLNRRGVCFFIQCKNCSYTPICHHCSVSLTLHNDNELHCHYCGKKEPYPTQCPSCKKDNFLKKGIGTQQVVSILEKLFPMAHIARADLDTSSKKKEWHKTIEQFNKGTIDIMVGTQTITKGYHFPKVTLVGILWADLNLNFPAYHAAETTLQQLIQVAGRAGRESAESLVLVQTMIDHPIFKFINEINYIGFYASEISKRMLLSYPPCGRFSEIELIHKNESTVEKDAQKIINLLAKNKNITILGPAIPPVSKIKNLHRRKIYLKAASFIPISEAYQSIKSKKFASKHYFTPASF